jgi:hypothetical protein
MKGVNMTNDTIIAREAKKVNKPNVCCWPGCENETEPGCPLCPECLKWERAEEANQDAEHQTSEQGVGYMFGDPVDRSWWGYDPKEVLA